MAKMTHFWPIFDPFLTPFLDPFWAKIPPKKGLFRSKRGLKRGSKSDPKSDHFRPPSEGSPILIPVKSTRKWHPWPGWPPWWPWVVAMGGLCTLYCTLYSTVYHAGCPWVGHLTTHGQTIHGWSDDPIFMKMGHLTHLGHFWDFGSKSGWIAHGGWHVLRVQKWPKMAKSSQC